MVNRWRIGRRNRLAGIRLDSSVNNLVPAAANLHLIALHNACAPSLLGVQVEQVTHR